MWAVLILLALGQVAVAGETRRACRAACGEQIVACAMGTQRPKARCKRVVLRACRKQGVAVCAPPSTTTTSTVTTTTTTMVEAFQWFGVWSFVGTNPIPDSCHVPAVINATVTISGTPDGVHLLVTGGLTLNPCGEGGIHPDGRLGCFDDLTPARFESAVGVPPANGQPAMLTVGWHTAYEDERDCRAYWSGPLTWVGDLPPGPPS